MLNKACHLLLRTSLLPGESLPSYLVRLAKLNGYHTPDMVIQLCQEELSRPDIVTRPTRAETFARLADLIKLDDDRLYASSVHNFVTTLLPAEAEPGIATLRSGVTVPLLPLAVQREHTWPETEAQFCPRCLKEAAYHRLAWLPQAVSVCFGHHCLLVKGCPACGSKLKLEEVVEGCCRHCNFDLRTSPTISVADDVLGLFSQQAIQFWLRITTSIQVAQYGWPHRRGFVLYQVVHGLHRAIRTIQRRWDYLHDPFEVDTAISVFPCEQKTHLTPFKSYVLYATALKALLNWPHGFYEFLNAFKFRDEAEPSGTVANDLGSIYTTWLMETWKQPKFSFVQAAFEPYLQENFAFSLALQQKYRGSTGYAEAIGADSMTYHDAAQRLNTSVVIVARADRLGLLRSHSQSGKKSPPQRFKVVSREAVSALKQRWRYGIPLAETAQLLGVSNEITQGMMTAGLIKAVTGPELDGYRVWKIGSQSLAYFFKRLERGGVRYRYDQPVKLVSLASAAETVAKEGLDTVFLIERILAGDLRGYWPPEDRNLGQLRVSVEDLEALQRAYQGQPIAAKMDVEVTTTPTEMNGKAFEVCLTGSQLARQLGVEQSYLRLWIRRGSVRLASEPKINESQS